MTERAMRRIILFAFIALMPLAAWSAAAQEYAAMKGVTSVPTVFDFRVGDAKVALAHLDLIHSMRKNPSMRKEGEPPQMVVVFIGPSVNLIAEENSRKAATTPIAKKIAAMDKDGVRFEVCMTTAHALDVPADAIPSQVVQVGNGWISLAGYQQKGYSMIADF